MHPLSCLVTLHSICKKTLLTVVCSIPNGLVSAQFSRSIYCHSSLTSGSHQLSSVLPASPLPPWLGLPPLGPCFLQQVLPAARSRHTYPATEWGYLMTLNSMPVGTTFISLPVESFVSAQNWPCTRVYGVGTCYCLLCTLRKILEYVDGDFPRNIIL